MSTLRWNGSSFGAPNGRPRGNGTQSARGGLICAVCSRIRLIAVVATPVASM
jgi:hypothetical protein